MIVGEEFTKTPLLSHLMELKTRLIRIFAFFLVAFAVSYAFAGDIYIFLTRPLADAIGDEGRRMIYTSLTEAFFTYMKLAFFAAIFLSFPMIASQVYYFLAPGLYKRERYFMIPFMAAAPVLFIAGAACVYYFIMPLAWEFFLSFETSGQGGMPIQLEAKVSEYLSLVMHLMIGFGLSFQMPIILMILVKLGVIDVAGLKRNRRYAIVFIVILAAVLTPPDVISQIGLATMLYGLYELAIIGSGVITARRPKPETEI